MKNVAIWASRHQLISRWTIGIGLFLLYWMAFAGGFFFHQKTEITATPVFTLVFYSALLALLLLALVKYPLRQKIKQLSRHRFYFYTKWKVYDVLFVTCLILAGGLEGVKVNTTKISENKTIRLVSESLTTLPLLEIERGFVAKDRKSNVITRFIDGLQSKLVKALSTIYKRLEAKTDWALISAYTLYILGFLALILVITFFSCQLSCAGYVGWSIVLLVGGQLLTGLLIYWLTLSTKNSRDRALGRTIDKMKNRKTALIVALIPIAIEIIYLLMVIVVFP